MVDNLREADHALGTLVLQFSAVKHCMFFQAQRDKLNSCTFEAA